MRVEKTSIDGLLIFQPDRYADHRGYFSETYNADSLRQHGVTTDFVQDNQSLSLKAGTVRGLHFQTPPFDQVKLVRALSGAIWDVAVDLRRSSPTYGQHFGVELTAEEGLQLYVPSGFAHGFCTLTDNTEVLYKVSAPYSKEHEGGIIWNDPDLSIPWPVAPESAILSEKDLILPSLLSIATYFE
ncbi:MAG: dTDP-4-dehydrorhamnose 3,5-epimerase [Rhodospirillales bacterium]|nr:dTDP-4-dehydrorhamnose 3,5-epimerase [Rhodospirillales bacterium]